jgi:hypothetical protein
VLALRIESELILSKEEDLFEEKTPLTVCH